MRSYTDFLQSKSVRCRPAGLSGPFNINPATFDFQSDLIRWSLRRGRSAIFADCGMGKTLMQLEWAKNVSALGDVLILCPLAVAQQTVAEGAKFGIDVRYKRDGLDVEPGITITNYEMLPHFDVSRFTGVALDESSILKHYEGKFRNLIIQSFSETPYRSAFTATPAPNDHMELGNHAEFLGVMSRTEMLSTFFVHDGAKTSQWRLKRHAEEEFWKWVCSWAVLIRKPSDLGYEDGNFILPPLNVEQITIDVPNLKDFKARTLQERLHARQTSIKERVRAMAERANANDEPWLIWCNLNDESDELELAINGAVQVKGSERPEHKSTKFQKFASGEIKRLITKPSIAGFGMNWQHCWNVGYVGLSDSWEDYYQTVRRCWRFGQQRRVNVVVITSTAEGAVVENIQRKETDANTLATQMINNMHSVKDEDIKATERVITEYKRDSLAGENWEMQLGDCVELSRELLPDESIDYSIFSPPFASLYTYSASDRDIGNNRSYSEFSEHFYFMAQELFRVMKPGRNLSFHCMNLPTTKAHHGYIGIQDFRGDLIRVFQKVGFIYHSEVCIWKNPVTAMQRTKALGLLHKQVVKDSVMSRQGIADYLITMRKPGENQARVDKCFNHYVGDMPIPEETKYTHDRDNRNPFSITVWQRYASPVWMDINPSNTLQYRSAREHKDEKHICPLQLEVIKRALVLWSNPGDLVLSPFAGIGSEGHESLLNQRRFLGFELKESYFKQAAANLTATEQQVLTAPPILAEAPKASAAPSDAQVLVEA